MDMNEQSQKCQHLRSLLKNDKHPIIASKGKFAYLDDLPRYASSALMIDFMDLQLLMHVTVSDCCTPISIGLP